jgi:hypothetical protein
MLLRLTHIIAAILVATPLLLVVHDVRADELPEGIKVTVVAEYRSRVSNLETVRLVQVLMEPEAEFDNVLVKNEEYCELKKGRLSHTNHTTGITDVFTKGARWAPPKGDHHTVTNTGDEVADMWVYQLIEKGQEEDKM